MPAVFAQVVGLNGPCVAANADDVAARKNANDTNPKILVEISPVLPKVRFKIFIY